MSKPAIRPPPERVVPEWATTKEYKAKVADAAHKKFVRHVVNRVFEAYGLTTTDASIAMRHDNFEPGACVQEAVPLLPWSRCLYLERPGKKGDRLELSTFFGLDPDGVPELNGTNLWKEFISHEGRPLIVFKAAGIRGADERLFVMFTSTDGTMAARVARIVIPQTAGHHVLVMQLNDYLKL